MNYHEDFEFTEEELLEKLGVDPSKYSWSSVSRIYSTRVSDKRSLESPYMRLRVSKKT